MKNKLFIKLLIISATILIFGPVMSLANGVERDVDGTPLPPNIKYKVFIHYPNHGKPRPSLTPPCTVTSNDQISDYGTTGWHLTGAEVYRLNESTVPANLGVENVYSAVNTAWVTWNSADTNIVVSAGPAISLTRPKYDGTNLIAWGSVPNNAIAVTYTWYNSTSGEQKESDTIFNKKLKWSYTSYSADCGGIAGTYDVGNIATHEFGHWVGLNDLYNSVDKDLTMYGYGFTAELKKDTLGAGDKLGAANITP